MYNRNLDKAKSTQPLVLQKFDGEHYNVETFEDPIMRRLATEDKADIFATDVAIAAIMTANKSVFSWDVLIKRFQNKIFIDKRDDANMLDYQTINETNPENQPLDDDTINGVKKLLHEATDVYKALQYQCYDKQTSFEFGEEDPFIEDEDEIAVKNGYVYKVWQLSKRKRVCIRSQVHSYMKKLQSEEDEPSNRTYVNVYPFLEYEPNQSKWKSCLETTMPLLITKEIQGNSNKISRWVVQSLLAGVSHLKFVFISRRKPQDPNSHHILGTYGIETKKFMNQVNLNLGIWYFPSFLT